MNSKIIIAFSSLAGLMTGIVMKAAEEGRLPEMWPLKRAIFSRNRRAGKFCGCHGSAKRYATALGGGGMAVKCVNHILKQES